MNSHQGIKTEINRGTVLGVRGIVQGFFLLFFAWYSGSKIKLHGMVGTATIKAKEGLHTTAFHNIIFSFSFNMYM